MRLQVGEAVANDLVSDVAVEFDHEAVLPETRLRRTTFESGQVQITRGETTQDAVERTGSVRVLETNNGGSIVTRRGRNRVTAEQHETRHVARRVLNVVGEYVEPVNRRRDTR